MGKTTLAVQPVQYRVPSTGNIVGLSPHSISFEEQLESNEIPKQDRFDRYKRH